jgi:hypothetical protein
MRYGVVTVAAGMYSSGGRAVCSEVDLRGTTAWVPLRHEQLYAHHCETGKQRSAVCNASGMRRLSIWNAAR